MTTMDSDSASQDSDDGRRFRFEATRKDSAALADTTSRTKSPAKKKSKHKSSRYESSRHYHRERKERSKHESDRKAADKDLRHSTSKHSKQESKNSRQEDGKNSSKDHRDGKDASIGFTVNDRGFRNSNGGDEKEKSRDSKRQSDRDRSIHLAQRSRERSYEKNHHEEQTSSDKQHRSRHHERHGHRSRQSGRVKSSNGDHRSREDHGRHDSSRKTLIKEDSSQNSKDYFSSKNVERERGHSEARSCENTKKDSSVNAQDCKNLDLSQFDVLSEIDENASDERDYESNLASSPREIKLHDSGDRLESRATSEARENDEDAKSEKAWREELSKVKKRNCDPVCSSRSNPNAVSDSSLSPTPLATISIVRDTSTSSAKEKFERTITYDTSELSDSEEKKHSDVFSDETRPERDAEQTESIYGPLLLPRFVSNISNSDEDSLLHTLDKNKIGDEVVAESRNDASDPVRFIGPRQPTELSNRQNEEQEEAKDTDTFATETDNVFGPVLPPHLLQRQCVNDSRDRIIGPVLPDAMKLDKEGSDASESDEDCAIGPLPADHPALRNSRVHEKLDLRAQQIRNEGYSEEVDIESKREEWMTELPPVQVANLGLGPRKFRVREGPDTSDRSCWTDTPTQKARKQKDLEIKKLNVPEANEKDVEEFYEADMGRSKKRERSLLEIHQSKIAKKKKKKEKEAEQTGISTRRPFDRNIDLQVTRIDQAQRKTILMKAQLLDDRFSRGRI